MGDGTLPPTTASQLTKIKDPDKQRELAGKALSGEITSVETAKAAQAKGGKTPRPRRTTNETFRTTGGVKVDVSARKDVGDAGIIDALLEVVESVRKRSRMASQQAA